MVLDKDSMVLILSLLPVHYDYHTVYQFLWSMS